MFDISSAVATGLCCLHLLTAVIFALCIVMLLPDANGRRSTKYLGSRVVPLK